MPNPFLPTFSGKRYSVGFEALKERPAIAELVGRCVSIWSYVDNELGGLFGVLLGTDSEAAHRVFLVLRRWSQQKDALNAAAEGRLSEKEKAVYQSLISEYSFLESQRNDLAHGCFGICPDDEDLLFVINVQHHVLWQADTLPKLKQGGIEGDSHQGLKDKMYVYRIDELGSLYDKMEKLWFDFFYFNGYLREPQNSFRCEEFKALADSRISVFGE